MAMTLKTTGLKGFVQERELDNMAAMMDTVNEAQHLLTQVESALSQAGKQLDKEEKKRVKTDCSALSKLLMKSKPEKMSEADLTALRNAMENLRQSAAHLLSMTGTQG